LDANSSSEQRLSVVYPPHQQPAGASDARRYHPWITGELLADTQRVWSEAYGREVSADEAVEILGSVKRLAAALLHAGCKEQAL
jgi:hypothetical protein